MGGRQNGSAAINRPHTGRNGRTASAYRVPVRLTSNQIAPAPRRTFTGPAFFVPPQVSGPSSPKAPNRQWTAETLPRTATPGKQRRPGQHQTTLPEPRFGDVELSADRSYDRVNRRVTPNFILCNGVPLDTQTVREILLREAQSLTQFFYALVQFHTPFLVSILPRDFVSVKIKKSQEQQNSA